MEIQLVASDSLKLKGRSGSIGVNPKGKGELVNASILIGSEAAKDGMTHGDGSVVINGPGEYEISGIKISGVRNKKESVYSLTIDGVAVLVGTLSALVDAQQKLKEHNVAAIDADENLDAAFVTNVASNALLFYGTHAKDVVNKLAKENVKHMPKFVTTADKLPAEMETVLLASSS